MNLFSFQVCPGLLFLVLLTPILQLVVNVQCQYSSEREHLTGQIHKPSSSPSNSSVDVIHINTNNCTIQNSINVSDRDRGFSSYPSSSSSPNNNLKRRNTNKRRNSNNNIDNNNGKGPELSNHVIVSNCSLATTTTTTTTGDDRKKERKRIRRKNRNGNPKKRGKGQQKRGNNGQEAVDTQPRRHRHADLSKLSLWIDEQQVKLFSGFSLEIHVITDGFVQPYILDPNFEQYLPVIPSEVGVVNFTWRAGDRKYFYHFDRLNSFNEDILLPPIVSIDTRGRVPRKPKAFSVFLPCSGTQSGVALFTVGLLIETKKGPLPGTPLRLRLRKECTEKRPGEPDPECDRKCANGGWCNKDRVCRCPEGYMGPYCQSALCYPQCMNGGVCSAPGVCSCPEFFHGSHCEGGICGEKCLNGGKCVQKDTCECTKGYYGQRCEYSKCMIPCLNGGRCKGVNLCRCPPNFSGDHCEIGLASTNRTITQRHSCSLPCRHGRCVGKNQCDCFEGFYGRRCQRRSL